MHQTQRLPGARVGRGKGRGFWEPDHKPLETLTTTERIHVRIESALNINQYIICGRTCDERPWLGSYICTKARASSKRSRSTQNGSHSKHKHKHSEAPHFANFTVESLSQRANHNMTIISKLLYFSCMP